MVGGRLIPGTVSLDSDKQQATFTFASKFPNGELPAGKVELAIAYTGTMNDNLRGFYLSKTAKRSYAVTQFEATNARRAFPSFDEPAFKATFDISLTVDAGDTVISNRNVITDKPAGAGLHTLTFAMTPRMSTYLVAFLVGHFKCVSGESDGTPIRACATPGQEEKGRFAVAVAEYVLHYYNRYFGIKYPMPKLDMIGIPDFEAGAMENFGAITYRETLFLLNEKTASLHDKEAVTSVVAHEMAHQWFGDMVTMQWWDNLWLNEGFASWMSSKPIMEWHPEWHRSQEKVRMLAQVLDLDAAPTTHAIRAKADTPSEIDRMFGDISYGKGSAVLTMVENYLGEETFRQGVHTYLVSHLYANATAEDFWNIQKATSHKPVDKIMESFVAQPGVTLITLTGDGKATIDAIQSRFYLDPSLRPRSVGANKTKTQTWTIPICYKSRVGPNCRLLPGNAHSSNRVSDSSFLFADANGRGYYRAIYPKPLYESIVARVEDALTPEERLSLLGDEWALMHSGFGTVGDYLDLVAAVKNDSSDIVLGAALEKLKTIETRIANDRERQHLRAWIRREFAPIYQSFGPTAELEPQDKHRLRILLFGVLGSSGDPAIIAESRAIAEKFIADPGSVYPEISQPAHGDRRKQWRCCTIR